MQIKLFRVYFGDYIANQERLAVLCYKRIFIGKPKILVLNSDQGLGQIKGTILKKNVIFPNVEVCVFKRTNKQLLWTTTSKSDGSYAFRNITVGLECFITAFDPQRNYNAVIADGVKAK